MSKTFEYWQSLVDQYQSVNDEIRVYEKRKGEYRLVSLSDHEVYQKKLNELHNLIDAMGTEFPEMFARYKILRERATNHE